MAQAVDTLEFGNSNSINPAQKVERIASTNGIGNPSARRAAWDRRLGGHRGNVNHCAEK